MAKNESETIYASTRKKKHMQEIKQKYLQFCDRRELAVRFPEDYLHLSLDDIDQTKIKTPSAIQNTKNCSGMLKLDNHCTGVIVTNGKFTGDRRVYAYLNSNQFPQDSNKTVSILFDVLLDVKEKVGKLPKKLFVQSDNCSRHVCIDFKKNLSIITLHVFENLENTLTIITAYIFFKLEYAEMC